MADLQVRAGPESIEAVAAGEAVCRYRFAPGLWKPYVQVLRLPGGPNLLDDAPADHPHHHGLWFGHGRLEDASGGLHDVWLERPGCGRIVHLDLTAAPTGWVARAEWRAADGRPLARDRRSFRFEVGGDSVVLALEYELEGPGVRLRGTNEAGLPLLRPAPWIAARGGGRAHDSEGREGESGIFGQPAGWVDCSGPGGGLRVHGDPGNLGRPERWFVRDYGPFGPNDGHFDPEPRPLPLRLKYTVVAHRGQGAGR
jgi:hypothetical protein